MYIVVSSLAAAAEDNCIATQMPGQSLDDMRAIRDEELAAGRTALILDCRDNGREVEVD